MGRKQNNARVHVIAEAQAVFSLVQQGTGHVGCTGRDSESWVGKNLILMCSLLVGLNFVKCAAIA